MSAARAFVIVQVAITDRDSYRAYELAGHPEIFDRFSGKLVVVDDNAEIVEGSWPFTRTILVEFPSKELARAWYESPDYQAVVGLRHAASTSNLVIVSALPRFADGEARPSTRGTV